jgi:hypothetical protein
LDNGFRAADDLPIFIHGFQRNAEFLRDRARGFSFLAHRSDFLLHVLVENSFVLNGRVNRLAFGTRFGEVARLSAIFANEDSRLAGSRLCK